MNIPHVEYPIKEASLPFACSYMCDSRKFESNDTTSSERSESELPDEWNLFQDSCPREFNIYVYLARLELNASIMEALMIPMLSKKAIILRLCGEIISAVKGSMFNYHGGYMACISEKGYYQWRLVTRYLFGIFRFDFVMWNHAERSSEHYSWSEDKEITKKTNIDGIISSEKKLSLSKLEENVRKQTKLMRECASRMDV